ncbi:phosphatase PAP2 family protein [Rhizomicrobium palustre]|nr:phosphatase PAP2 family protein [Rhizomicrobium palustre]
MLGRSAICAAVAFACSALPLQAKMTETAGTGIAIAMPLVAGGITLLKHDRVGTAQLFVTTALTVGTAYGLKQLIRECRPFAEPCSKGGGNWNSMPSDTTALAAAPAEFLRERYGWEYGIPAYAATAFVGWSRVDAQKHHWYDVAASAGISLLYNELITTRYTKRYGFTSDLQAQPNGLFASASYRF